MVTIFEATALISAASAIIVSIFAVMQLRHLEKHRNVEISMKLFEWAETDRLRKALKWMDNTYQFNNYTEFKQQEQKQTEAAEYPSEVTAFFEQVGFLVDKKFIDLDVVVDRLGHHIVTNYTKLKPYIAAIQKEKHDQAYGQHFQDLYQQTIKYMKKRCAQGETNFCTSPN